MHQIHWATILATAAAVLAAIIAIAALIVSARANRHAAASAEAARKSANAAEEANRLETARWLDEMAPELTATAEWSEPGRGGWIMPGSPEYLSVTVYNKSNRPYEVTSIKKKTRHGTDARDQSREDKRTLPALGSTGFSMGEYYPPGQNVQNHPTAELCTKLTLILESSDGAGKWERTFNIPMGGSLLDREGRPIRRPVRLTTKQLLRLQLNRTHRLFYSRISSGTSDLTIRLRAARVSRCLGPCGRCGRDA